MRVLKQTIFGRMLNFSVNLEHRSGKIIKIYQRLGLLSQDSLGLGGPYSAKKMAFSLKVTNICHIISFKAPGRF